MALLPMVPGVTLRLPMGELRLRPGEMIGRGRRATIRVDEPSVAEAHALLVVRGLELWLLALRGPLWSGAQQTQALKLVPGLLIRLAPEVVLEVVAVDAPTDALAIVAEGTAPRLLVNTTSIVVRPRLQLVQGHHGFADAVLWNDGVAWYLRLADADARSVGPGDSFRVAEHHFRLALMSQVEALGTQTGQGDKPIRVETTPDGVIVEQGRTRAEIVGVGASLLHEILGFDGPVDWEVVAREVWQGEASRRLRRAKFDMALVRIRRQLKDAGITRELILMTGTGLVQVVLRNGDAVEKA